MICPYCGKDKLEAQFYKSPIKTGAYLCRCKACTGDYYKAALERTKDQGMALWATCMVNDIPLRKTEYKAALETMSEYKAKNRPSLFMLYYTYLTGSAVPMDGVLDSDMDLSSFVKLPEEDAKAIIKNKAQNDDKKMAVWHQIWGDAYNAEDCKWLDDKFDAYTSEILEMDTAQEMLYRDLCRAHLEQFKGGPNKDVFQQIKTLMGMLKIDNFKSNVKTDAEKAFERRVAITEYTRPAECEELKDFLDKVGYEKEKAMMMRSLRNAIAGTREYPDIPKEEQ